MLITDLKVCAISLGRSDTYEQDQMQLLAQYFLGKRSRDETFSFDALNQSSNDKGQLSLNV